MKLSVNSLANRVLAFVALAVIVSMVTFGHFIMKSIDLHFAEQDAAELKVIALAVADRVRNADASAISIKTAVSNAISGHHDVYFRLYDEHRNLLYSSLDGAWSDPPHFNKIESLDVAHLHVWSNGSRTLRSAGFVFDAAGARFHVVSAIDVGFHLEFLADIRWKLMAILGIGGLLTLLAAWYGIHQAHAPLRRLEERVIEVEADRLHVQLPTERVPSELRRLVRSINEMIARLNLDFKRVSNFADDIAHELRTPLTNLVTQTQVALSQPRSIEEYRETLYSSLEEYESLSRLVNDLLWLAKSEHGLVHMTPTEINLSDEILHQCEYFEMLAEERGIKLRFSEESALVGGDREMIRRALFNLLSNALAHTPQGGEISVSLQTTASTVTLNVENDGDTIAPEHLPRLFDRFYQVDGARRRGEGAGLGLAIVKSIVERHGGSIAAYSASRRIKFSIRLPIVPQGRFREV